MGALFQSTPPRGGRPTSLPLRSARQRFNPRPRAGGDAETSTNCPRLLKFQSTPPRGGRRCGDLRGLRLFQVLIHAPARGATLAARHDEFELSSFNPRPRAGGDTASTATATVTGSFNPRPRAGGDMIKQRPSARSSCFNPRPRAGGDVNSLTTGCGGGGFNPRPRAGGDLGCKSREGSSDVSIHAPARGATRVGVLGRPRDQVSIHAPARGATAAILT